MNTVGERIRAVRVSRGPTIEKAALEMGSNAATWGRWERGEGFPSLAKISAMADMWDLSPAQVGWLVRGGEMPPDTVLTPSSGAR